MYPARLYQHGKPRSQTGQVIRTGEVHLITRAFVFAVRHAMDTLFIRLSEVSYSKKRQSHIALRTKRYLFYALRKESRAILLICCYAKYKQANAKCHVHTLLPFPYTCCAFFFLFFFNGCAHSCIAVLVFIATREAPDSPS